MPRGGETQVSLYGRGTRQETLPLLDRCVPYLLNQSSVHDGQRASHHAVGARGGCRGRTGKARQKNPEAMRTRRKTVEHPFGTMKMRMGATHFLMKTLPKV